MTEFRAQIAVLACVFVGGFLTCLLAFKLTITPYDVYGLLEKQAIPALDAAKQSAERTKALLDFWDIPDPAPDPVEE